MNAQRDRSGVECIIDMFLEHLVSRRLSPATIVCRRDALRSFAVFAAARGRLQPQDVEASDIQAFRDAMIARGLRNSTIDIRMRSVRLLFCYLEEQGILFENPARDLVMPRVRSLPAACLSEPDMRRLLDATDTARQVGTRDRAIIEVLYATGIRSDECRRLTLDDVNLETPSLRLTGKGAKERMVPLGRHAAVWLQRYLSEVRPAFAPAPDSRRLWISRRGTGLALITLGVIVRTAARIAGLKRPVSPHAIRRSCATHMIAGGAHPLAVAELLGHSCLRTLSHYLRLSISELKAAHAATKPGE